MRGIGYPSPVVFEVPSGELIRFSASADGLFEEVDSGNGFEPKGIAEEIFYIVTGSGTQHKLIDHRGMGGCLPSDSVQREGVLLQLTALCEAVGVPHNITESGAIDAIFPTPSGDIIRLSGGNGYIEESIREPDGSWAHQGTATHFVYHPTSRKLLDQQGKGGVLPVENLGDLLGRIRRLCDASEVPHNLAHPLAVRHRSSSAGDGSSEGSVASVPSSGGSAPGFTTGRALLVGLCESRDSTVSRSVKKLYKLLSEQNPNGNVAIQTLGASAGQFLAREDLLRGLEWLVEGSHPGTTLFLGLIGSAVTQAEAGEAGLELEGGDLFTQEDIVAFVNTLPASVRLNIICDVSPTVDLLQLPYRAAANEGGGTTYTEQRNSLFEGTRAQIVVVSPFAASLVPQGTQLGVFSDMCVKVLSGTTDPRYSDLLAAVKVALGNVRSGIGSLSRHFKRSASTKPVLLPMVSSNMHFDVGHDRFDVSPGAVHYGDARALPAPVIPRRRRNLVMLGNPESLPPPPQLSHMRSGSVRAPSSTYSRSSALSSPTPSQQGQSRLPLESPHPGVRDALLRIYQKHNPNRISSVERFVLDYQGQYRSMFELIAAKYQDPSIMAQYNPAWGP